ncbi:MAG: hypothetical protein K2N34_09075 [Lachnospiraceae bacterium]|nr:hypothetical protein [Lachnospiraceae bacterium]
MELKKILDMINGKKLIIYGTGFVAEHFYEGLSVRKKEGQVIAFAETTHLHKTEKLHGVPVICVDEIPEEKDSLICIAVHESIRDEIIEELERRGHTRYTWVYSIARVLTMGDPIESDCFIFVQDIINSQMEYGIAIRTLAAEQYYGWNHFGYQIYLKLFTYFNEEKTAQRRLEQYKNLMKSWDEKGYLMSEKISVDEQMRLLDGFHRVTLALFHGCDQVMGDIYHRVENYREYRKTYVHSVDQLRNMGLTGEEIHVVVDKDEEIREKCGKISGNFRNRTECSGSC